MCALKSWILNVDSEWPYCLWTSLPLVSHTHTHMNTHIVSTVRPSPTVAKVAMATFHRNGNYN